VDAVWTCKFEEPPSVIRWTPRLRGYANVGERSKLVAQSPSSEVLRVGLCRPRTTSDPRVNLMPRQAEQLREARLRERSDHGPCQGGQLPAIST
jgi:hypothetical protein